MRWRPSSGARTVGASLALCELGVVSGDLWRSCRSLWPNALLYRRCSLGLLDAVYSFEPPDEHVARIPQRVRSELLTLVALSPLFWTNLRAPVSTELGASDASDDWCAVVTSTIGERTASELWRVRDRRAGCYVRCETELEAILRRAWNEGEPDEQVIAGAVFAMTDSEPPDLTEHEKRYSWVSDLVESLGWRELVRYRVAVPEHINMKELRAYRTRLRHAARRAECHGTRRLTLLDSSVVRGTASKWQYLADGSIEFGSLWCRSFSQRTSKTVRCLFRPSICPPMVRRVVVARVPCRHVRRPRGSKRSKLPITRSLMPCTPRRRVASRAFFSRRSRWRTRNALRYQS